ncbi:hypothetical protein R2F61_02190 [Mollicutes bacterium LVI A0078]|nr:hypothetical protein RZE84_02220 [Mollicutes bacterium LVI A0075]WOO91378.1 hypothetical protein R2F61_02190 [Mollicutes bacterium LVI A0078]
MGLFDKALGAEIATNNYNRNAKHANREVNAMIKDYEKTIAQLRFTIDQLEAEKKRDKAEIRRLKLKVNDFINTFNAYIDED